MVRHLTSEKPVKTFECLTCKKIIRPLCNTNSETQTLKDLKELRAQTGLGTKRRQRDKSTCCIKQTLPNSTAKPKEDEKDLMT